MTCRALLRSWCVAVAVRASCVVVSAITPPELVSFNYPPPPIEGKTDYFTIAENGQARCCLVVPAAGSREAVSAAHHLEVYLKLVTGAEFKLAVEDKAPAGLSQIHFGETKAAQQIALDLPPARYGKTELLNVNGYLIKTVSPMLLVIRGATPKATVLGAVGLLRRYAGVRRYWPGEPGGIGDVVPKNPDLRLPQIEWRDWPYFISRIMSGLDERGPQTASSRKTLFADFWRMNYTIPSNESYYRLMEAWEHLGEPELFPLINGKRFVPNDPKEGANWQPCVSNPRVAGIMADSIKEFFRKNPDKFALNLAVNDGYGDCTCDKCRAMDAPGADPLNRIGLCDRYVKFDNKVAELVARKFPDKILAFIAYGSMRLPPTTVRLHRMLLPVLCVGGNTFQMWDDWQKTGAGNMGVYFYHDDMWFILPKMDIHQSAKRLRYLVGSGLARHFYQEFYGVYPLDGMVGYVEQELLWDPRQSEDAVLEEFYRKFFGKAAAPMKAFYETLEAGYTEWLARAGLSHPFGVDVGSLSDRSSLKQFSVLPVAMAAKAEANLQPALAAADDPLAVKRIELVKAIFGFAVPGARAYWACERLRGANPASLADAGHVVAGAGEAVDSVLALADYKFAVMEKPEVKAYADHGDRDTLYNNLQRGTVTSDVVSDIGLAFDKVTAFLRGNQGAAKAQAWWTQRQQIEQRPLLRQLMSMAATEAGGQTLANIVNDPSFEQRGAKQSASVETELAASAKQTGVSIWNSAGTPLKAALTAGTAHAGRYSLVFWDTQRSGVFESIAVKPGDFLRLSVWVKHNEPEGTYTFEAIPRSPKGMLARPVVAVPKKPGEWQKLEMSFIIPPEANQLNVFVFVHNQAPGAKIWVDDFFIGKKAAN